MNVIIKPIMYFMFCCAMMFFINILLLFITTNEATMVLSEAVYIVESNGSDVASMQSDINELEITHNNEFSIELEYLTNQEYLDSTNVVVTTTYNYIGRDHSVEINKNEVVMNKQI